MLACASGVWAEGKPLACQDVASAGLKWEIGAWNVKRFPLQKFILVIENGIPTKKSTVRAMGYSTDEYADQITCKVVNVLGHILCHDIAGTSLYIDPKTNTGGLSHLVGSTDGGDLRDTVAVKAFTCQPF